MNSLINAAAPLSAAIAITLFALPSYVGAIRQRGFGRAVLLALSLAIFSLTVMVIAVKVSYPFGKFTFSDKLGYKIANLVPWTVAIAYPPLIMGAFWLANKCTKSPLRIILTGLFATAFHVALDPALTRMGIWQWETPGPFYGVPLMNFGGWLASGLLAGWIISKIWGDEPTRRSLAYSAFGIVWFWAGVNFGLKQWVPGAIGFAIGLVLVLVMRAEKKREQTR